jgi:Uma2 family endonuclease
MNTHTPDRSRSGPRQRPTTQAAEGVPRLKWTLEEFERLGELGIFTDDDRIELIGGELVPMSPKGRRHETVRDEILNWIAERLPKNVRFSSEIGWRPEGHTYLEPDILIYPKGFSGVAVQAAEVLLLIEVASSSLKMDATSKAAAYAGLGVREYWVVNAVTLETLVHSLSSETGYGSVVTARPDETLVPLLLPGLGLKMSDLDLAE